MKDLLTLYLIIGLFSLRYSFLNNSDYKKLNLKMFLIVSIIHIITWPFRLFNRFKKSKEMQSTQFSNIGKSKFKEWINLHSKELNKKNITDEDFLFGGLIKCICHFDLEIGKELIPKGSLDLNEDICFFELGCFMYAHYNISLLLDDVDINIILDWEKEFIKNFVVISSTLKTESDLTIREIIQERVQFHQEIYSENDFETSLSTLSSIVYRSNKNAIIIENIQQSPLILDFEFSFFSKNIVTWSKYFMKIGIDNIKEYARTKKSR